MKVQFDKGKYNPNKILRVIHSSVEFRGNRDVDFVHGEVN